MKTKTIFFLLIMILISGITISCHKGIGCPADKYNNWKQIEANKKASMKNPKDPDSIGKSSKKKKK